MALLGINPPRQTDEASKLEKVAMGLDIATKVLALPLHVADYIQQQKKHKYQQRVDSAKIEMETEPSNEKDPKAVDFSWAGLGWRKPRTTPEQIRAKAETHATIGEKYRAPKEGEVPTVEFPEEYGGGMVLREKPVELSDYEKKIFDAYSSDYDVIPEESHKKSDLKLSVGGHDTWWRPKPKEGGEGEALTKTDALRKEFLKQSEQFQSQADSLARIHSNYEKALGQDAAAQVSIIYNYIKMLDPATGVKEGEIALAGQAKGVPEWALNIYNKVTTGSVLAPEGVTRFVETAERLYKSGLSAHLKREEFYKKRAQYEKLPEQFVAPDIKYTFPNLKKATKALSDMTEEELRQLRSGGKPNG